MFVARSSKNLELFTALILIWYTIIGIHDVIFTKICVVHKEFFDYDIIIKKLFMEKLFKKISTL